MGGYLLEIFDKNLTLVGPYASFFSGFLGKSGGSVRFVGVVPEDAEVASGLFFS